MITAETSISFETHGKQKIATRSQETTKHAENMNMKPIWDYTKNTRREKTQTLPPTQKDDTETNDKKEITKRRGEYSKNSAEPTIHHIPENF